MGSRARPSLPAQHWKKFAAGPNRLRTIDHANQRAHLLSLGGEAKISA